MKITNKLKELIEHLESNNFKQINSYNSLQIWQKRFPYTSNILLSLNDKAEVLIISSCEDIEEDKEESIDVIKERINKEIKKIEEINKLKEIKTLELESLNIPAFIKKYIVWGKDEDILFYVLNYKDLTGWEIRKEYKSIEKIRKDLNSFIEEVKYKISSY